MKLPITAAEAKLQRIFLFYKIQRISNNVYKLSSVFCD